ncbi:MAG: formimidoylglutamate deiminase [Blastocatellia bacterium]|jgi:formimidoylglutamate deiminase|nr:formimidoylglutamate deiminase [Blastocatellia bacterium]
MAATQNPVSLIAWLPDLIFTGERFESGLALVGDAHGTIVRLARVTELKEEKRINLPKRALLPGMVNSHSHAFQRVLRGRTEYRSTNAPFRGGLPPGRSGSSPTLNNDSFWTWREMMYSAGTRLSPEDIYDASRMAFLEMALQGMTAVGEFHYLHYQPDGKPYDDPNLLAKEVVRAASDAGLRIALLRVAYARSGFQTEPNPRQARFIETDPEVYLRNLDGLIADVSRVRSPTVREGQLASEALPHGRASDTAWVGVAPHSVRAVPLDYLRQVIAHADQNNLKVHMHVAEQPAEVSACIEEHGRSPFALLQTEGLLSEHFTAVHAIHVTPKAIASFATTGAMVCACPTTERNLGDGVVPADEYLKHNVPICLGTDSHAQIDLLEDARELELHLRLQKLERAVLSVRSPTVREDPQADEALPNGRASDTAAMLFDCATRNGARSIGAPGGALEPGRAADFFTIDLDDPSIAGASTDTLLASIVFALSRAAVREVVVSGKPIVSEGQHLLQEEIIERFSELQKRLWN